MKYVFFHSFIRISHIYSTSFKENIHIAIVINVINIIPLSRLLATKPDVVYSKG